MTNKQTTEAVKETIQDWLSDTFNEMRTDEFFEMVIEAHGIEIKTETQYKRLRDIVNTERNNLYEKVANCLYSEYEVTA